MTGTIDELFPEGIHIKDVIEVGDLVLTLRLEEKAKKPDVLEFSKRFAKAVTTSGSDPQVVMEAGGSNGNSVYKLVTQGGDYDLANVLIISSSYEEKGKPEHYLNIRQATRFISGVLAAYAAQLKKGKK